MEVRTVNVQRWSIVSQKPFETVVAAVEAAIGRPNMSEFAKDIAAAATYPEMRQVLQDAVSEIGLMEFMRLDVGAVLAKALPERNPKSIRLIIGNPLIMESMASLVPDAASYTPVAVFIDRAPTACTCVTTRWPVCSLRMAMRKLWRLTGTWISKSEECYRKRVNHLE
jgi:hypothetical protein